MWFFKDKRFPIAFLYRISECLGVIEENKEIEKAMLCDSELEARFKELNGIKKRLDFVLESPSSKTTSNILNYSKSLNLLSNK